MTLSTGMLGLKPTRKKPIINFVSLGKRKLMIKSQNPPRFKDKLELKCKNKDFLSIKELIN